MAIEITSTTDSPEQVTLAMGGAKPVETVEESAPVDETSKTTEESETSEPEVESEETDETEEKPDDESSKPLPKGVLKKFDKLTRRAADNARERDYWKAEALKAKTPPADPKQEPAKVQTAPKAEGKPNADDFDTHSEFVEALSDWKVEQKLAERETKSKEIQLKTEFETKISSFQTKVKEFAEATADFEDVIEAVNDVWIPPALVDAILENGPEFQYELAKNREELVRIAKLPAMQVAREIGKLEARLSASKHQPKTEEKKLTTKAPQPIRTVGSSSSGVVRKSIYDESLSQREYEALRAKQTAG